MVCDSVAREDTKSMSIAGVGGASSKNARNFAINCHTDIPKIPTHMIGYVYVYVYINRERRDCPIVTHTHAERHWNRRDLF